MPDNKINDRGVSKIKFYKSGGNLFTFKFLGDKFKS